jgi:hypothetical protein
MLRSTWYLEGKKAFKPTKRAKSTPTTTSKMRIIFMVFWVLATKIRDFVGVRFPFWVRM